jgi:hypothetical protein
MTTLPTYCSSAIAASIAHDRGRLDEWIEAEESYAAEGLVADATALIEARFSWRGQPAGLTHSPPEVQVLGLPRSGIELSEAAQLLRAAEATVVLALRLWRERAPSGGKVVVAEELPDWSRRYQVAAPEGWDVVDALLAPMTAAPVPSGYAVA